MRPGARRLDAGDGADQARLAGAVGADDGDQLALLGAERDAVERLRVAVEEVEAFHFEDHGRGPPVSSRPRALGVREPVTQGDIAIGPWSGAGYFASRNSET